MRLLKTNLLMTMIALCFSVSVKAQIVIHGTVTQGKRIKLFTF